MKNLRLVLELNDSSQLKEGYQWPVDGSDRSTEMSIKTQ